MKRADLQEQNRHLLASLVAGHRSPDGIAPSQWPEIIPQAVRDRLGPLLLRAVRQSLQVDDNDPLWQPLLLSERQSFAHYTLLYATQRRLNGAFTQAGIPAIWLKGIALAQTLYPSPHLRPMLDLDVLIPTDCRSRALEIAVQNGYRLPEVDYLKIVGAPESVRQHDALTGGPSGNLCLEIHFRLLGFAGDYWLPSEQMKWFWEHTQANVQGEQLLTILQPEAQILYLCAHAILQHGEAYLDLLHLYDLHLLATIGNIDWTLVIEQTLALGWSFPVHRALELTADYFSTRIPDNLLSRLKEKMTSEESAAAAMRLQKNIAYYEEWKTIYRRLPPIHRIRLLWITMFPPPSIVRDLYHLDPKQPVLPYYFARWFHRGQEVVRAINPHLHFSNSRTMHK